MDVLEVNNLTDNVDVDPAVLLHARTGCTATAKLIEAYLTSPIYAGRVRGLR